MSQTQSPLFTFRKERTLTNRVPSVWKRVLFTSYTHCYQSMPCGKTSTFLHSLLLVYALWKNQHFLTLTVTSLCLVEKLALSYTHCYQSMPCGKTSTFLHSLLLLLVLTVWIMQWHRQNVGSMGLFNASVRPRARPEERVDLLMLFAYCAQDFETMFSLSLIRLVK